MKYLLLSSVAALALAGSAFAQDSAAPSTAAQPPAAAAQGEASASTSTVSDADVQKVAALAADVKALNETAQPKIAAAADATAKAAAQKELNDSIMASLTKHGLTVEKYNEIATLAQTDKALAARLAAANNPAASQGSSAPASANEQN